MEIIEEYFTYLNEGLLGRKKRKREILDKMKPITNEIVYLSKKRDLLTKEMNKMLAEIDKLEKHGKSIDEYPKLKKYKKVWKERFDIKMKIDEKIIEFEKLRKEFNKLSLFKIKRGDY